MELKKGRRVEINRMKGEAFHEHSGRIEKYDKKEDGYYVYINRTNTIEFFKAYELTKPVLPKEKRENRIQDLNELLHIAVESKDEAWFNKIHKEINFLKKVQERKEEAKKLHVLKNLAIELNDNTWVEEITKKQIKLHS